MKQFNSNFAAFKALALSLATVSTVFTLTSCTASEEVPTPSDELVLVPVNICVNDFSISQTDITPGTRAAEDPADYDGVGAIDLAFYSGTTEVYKVTRLKSATSTYTTFGNFSCDLPIGTYTMVVIGRGYWDEDAFSITSPTAAGYTSERPRETFCHTQSVTVTNTTPLNLNVTLNRVMAQINVVSTDNRPAGAAKVRTIFAAGSKSFNPTTGLALDDGGFSQINTPSSAKANYLANVFLATDEETMNITLQALDANDNILLSKVVEDVPLKRNRKTTLRGALFTASASAAFQVETAWLSELPDINF